MRLAHAASIFEAVHAASLKALSPQKIRRLVSCVSCHRPNRRPAPPWHIACVCCAREKFPHNANLAHAACANRGFRGGLRPRNSGTRLRVCRNSIGRKSTRAKSAATGAGDYRRDFSCERHCPRRRCAGIHGHSCRERQRKRGRDLERERHRRRQRNYRHNCRDELHHRALYSAGERANSVHGHRYRDQRC